MHFIVDNYHYTSNMLLGELWLSSHPHREEK